MKAISALAAVLVLAGTQAVVSQTRPTAADRLKSAAQVVRGTRPHIPAGTFNRARCVAVFPGLRRSSFGSGREEGRGVLSCRAGEGWSAPVFLRIARGGWGFPAGTEELDLLLLVMNEDGAQKFLRNNLAFGGDASIGEGPVGGEGAQHADGSDKTEIVAYSYTPGSVTGVNLTGATARPDTDANRDVYGPGGTPNIILASRSISAPTEATPLFQALGGVASPRVTRAVTEGPPSVPAARPAVPDLRSQLIAIEQTIDRLLADTKASPVGTSGRPDAGQDVSVPRERLEQLRSQIEAAIGAFQSR